MKSIFPILPLLILAGWGNLAWGQLPQSLQRAAAPSANSQNPAPPAPGAYRRPTAGQGGAAPTHAAANAPRMAAVATPPSASLPSASLPANAAAAAGQPPNPPPSTATPSAALPAAVAAAAAPSTGTNAFLSPQQRSAELLQRAVAVQHDWRAVAARMRTEVNLLDQHLVGSGTYVQGPAQQGTWRYEMRIQTDHGPASLLQVCDGKQFWSYRQVRDKQELEWVDAARVARLIAKHKPNPDAQRAASASLPSVGLGVGGLPRLLRSINESWEFRGANESRLDKLPVWILEGSWKPATLAVLLPEQREAIETGTPGDVGKLPAHVPDRIVLYLGRDDLFPYRLEYHRDKPGDKEWERSAHKSQQPTLTLEWFEVRFNVPLARDQFYYNAGETKYGDVTGRHLEQLGLPLE